MIILPACPSWSLPEGHTDHEGHILKASSGVSGPTWSDSGKEPDTDSVCLPCSMCLIECWLVTTISGSVQKSWSASR